MPPSFLDIALFAGSTVATVSSDTDGELRTTNAAAQIAANAAGLFAATPLGVPAAVAAIGQATSLGGTAAQIIPNDPTIAEAMVDRAKAEIRRVEDRLSDYSSDAQGAVRAAWDSVQADLSEVLSSSSAALADGTNAPSAYAAFDRLRGSLTDLVRSSAITTPRNLYVSALNNTVTVTTDDANFAAITGTFQSTTNSVGVSVSAPGRWTETTSIRSGAATRFGGPSPSLLAPRGCSPRYESYTPASGLSRLWHFGQIGLASTPWLTNGLFA